MTKSFHLEIVSQEENLFSGEVQKLFATGVTGELEILVNHAPLLTALTQGVIWIVKEDRSEEGLIIFGGMLEVQSNRVIILADSAIRGEDIDEQAAMEAKKTAEKAIFNKELCNLDYNQARKNLNLAIAKLKIVSKLKALK